MTMFERYKLQTSRFKRDSRHLFEKSQFNETFEFTFNNHYCIDFLLFLDIYNLRQNFDVPRPRLVVKFPCVHGTANVNEIFKAKQIEFRALSLEAYNSYVITNFQ